MRIKSIRTEEYLGCPVYVRNFESVGAGEEFEYLTVIDNEIYAFPVTMRKSILKHFFRIPFTDDELKKLTEYILTVAHATIESVLEEKGKLSARKSREAKKK